MEDNNVILAAVLPSDVVNKKQGASSHDLNHEAALDYEFAWQRGYGALSLGEKQKPIAVQYVQEQKQHHQNLTFNPWLERCTDLDEGPADNCIRAESVPAVIHEIIAPYEISGDLLF